jgi:hypothetical protein
LRSHHDNVEIAPSNGLGSSKRAEDDHARWCRDEIAGRAGDLLEDGLPHSRQRCYGP